tara:strand:- start:898 stop:1158 length:261 start_codon:yes stop_codon:yes gene_type:complete
MNSKYKIKYQKYKNKYNNLKKKHKITGGMPEILIGLLSTLPLTSTFNIYSLINNNDELKEKFISIANLLEDRNNIVSGIIQKFENK